MAAYLVCQYLAKQTDRTQLSWSENWLWKGAVRDWRCLLREKKFNIPEAVKAWNKLLGKRRFSRPSLYTASVSKKRRK